MDTLDTSTDELNGAKVRVPYFGEGYIKARRTSAGGIYFWAVDMTINGKTARVWRSYDKLTILEIDGKPFLGTPEPMVIVKPPQVYSYFHPYMALEASKTGIVNFPAMPTVANLNTTQSPQIETVLEDLVIAPETPDAAVHIPRDNASPEPRPLVVVAPVLRLFTARVAVERWEMVA